MEFAPLVVRVDSCPLSWAENVYSGVLLSDWARALAVRTKRSALDHSVLYWDSRNYDITLVLVDSNLSIRVAI
jgi:hypothetical protein